MPAWILNLSGLFVVPGPEDVRAGVGYGIGGTQFTGTLELPAEEDVRLAVTYGADGTQYSGLLVVGGYVVPADTTDRFAVAKAWITQQRATHLARTVVYKRGASTVSVSATVTTSTFDEVDSYGVIHRVEYRDFIFPQHGLTPQAGDRILETVGTSCRVLSAVNATVR
jgi:hypothetical protein